MGKGGIIKRSLPVIIIAVTCILAFRQVAFLTETLKFDILDGYLPGHYFASECLRNNIFPLWNPYQQLGFPLYADMLNTNYIVDMFVGRLFPYTNVTFHVFFILYVIIAGIGAFRLAVDNGITVRLSLMAGIAYSLSGFITGNAQHIQFIAGAAWLPFCIIYFLRLMRDPRLLNALLFIVFTYLLITGGYPSFAILLGYGMFPVWLFFVVRNIRNKQNSTFKRQLLYGALVFLILAVLCAGVIISIRQAAPFVERYISLTHEYAVTNPFPPSALISLVSPFAAAVHPELFPTDISMNNHYFGVIVLILFFYALSHKISRTGILLLISASFLLLFSFGEYGFVHGIFFDYVPLFNKFRHPSSFRFITILLLLLFTGIQLSKYDPFESRYFDRFRTIYLTSLAAIVLISAISAVMILTRLAGPAVFVAKWQNFLNDFGIYGALFIQTFLFLIINLPFLYLIVFRRKVRLFYPLLISTLIVEMILFTSLNTRYTVTSQYDPLDIRAFLRDSPAGFPLPDEMPVSMHTDESAAHVPLINNTNIYSKSVSADYMYPFVLDGFRKLRSDSILFKEVTRHRVLYFEQPEKTGDTVFCKAFSPREMTFTIKSGEARKMVLQQNYYPGWKVRIDGEKADHYSTLGTLIGIDVPAGDHELTFMYENQLYVKATIGAFGLFVLILLTIQILKFKKGGTGGYRGLFNSALIIAGIIIISVPSESFAEKNRDSVRDLQKIIKDHPDGADVLVIMNVETIEPYLEVLSGKKFIQERFRNNFDVKELWNYIDTADFKGILYIWNNVTGPPAVEQVISKRFPSVRLQYDGERSLAIEFSKDSAHVTGRDSYLNTYEERAVNFSEGVDYDSAFSFSGLNSERLSGDRLFSSTFRKELEGKAINVLAMVRFRIHGPNSAHLVLSVERKGKSIWYEAADFKEFATQEEWNSAFIARNFTGSTLKKGDELVIYCWNSGKNEAVYLDDFYVQIGE